MSRPGLAPVDLSRLAPPQAIEELDFEAVVKAMRDQLVALFPPIANVIDLESQPARKLIECFAYREVLVRGRFNDGVRSVIPALASGANLDHLASQLGVARLLVRKGVNGAPDQYESDARLLRRMQLAPSAFGTAGAEAAYVFHALTAAPSLADASAIMTSPGEVLVTLLGADTAQPTEAEVAAVRELLRRTDVRPLTDVVSVAGPTVIPAEIDVGLRIFPGPSESALAVEARGRLRDWRKRMRALGSDVMRSTIAATAYVEGVHSVEVAEPTTDRRAAPNEVVEISSVTVRSLGVTE